MKDRQHRQLRSISTKFETRDDSGNLSIEGYFAVFDSVYDIAPGLSESIDPGAFNNTLSGDIRALINHDTTLVLGRTKANTLQLRVDNHGLWGYIDINPNDTDAMNIYNRVQRRDVDQCSFGFNILSEETDIRDNGDVHFTIKEVELFEVSVCTFPAYEDTNIKARMRDRDEIMKRRSQAWKEKMLRVMKGEQSNA